MKEKIKGILTKIAVKPLAALCRLVGRCISAVLKAIGRFFCAIGRGIGRCFMAIVRAIMRFKWGYVLISTVSLAVAASFLYYQQSSLDAVAVAVGVITITTAAVFTVCSLAGKRRGFSFAVKILVAVALLAAGFITLIAKQAAIDGIIAVLGFVILLDGSFKFHTTAMAKRHRVWSWWVMLGVSMILMGCGFITVRTLRADTENIAIMLGIFLAVEALANLIAPFMLGIIERREKREALAALKAEQNEPEAEEVAKSDEEEKTCEPEPEEAVQA